MDADESDLWVDALLLKIHAITGWAIPEKQILFVFTDQFKKKINESYSLCNPNEIEYAFRHFGTEVKDWGKQMNLSLIDEVMIPYMKKRYQISQLEEQRKIKQLPVAAPEGLDDKSMQEWSDAIKRDKISFEHLPIMLYDWMDKKGKIKISLEKQRQYLHKAKEYYLEKFNDVDRTYAECKQIIIDTKKRLILSDFLYVN